MPPSATVYSKAARVLKHNGLSIKMMHRDLRGNLCLQPLKQPPPYQPDRSRDWETVAQMCRCIKPFLASGMKCIRSFLAGMRGSRGPRLWVTQLWHGQLAQLL